MMGNHRVTRQTGRPPHSSSKSFSPFRYCMRNEALFTPVRQVKVKFSLFI